MTINYKRRQTYDCRRCGQTIDWMPGSMRRDMLKAKCCAYCTCLVTLWPRRIRHIIGFPMRLPFLALSMLGMGIAITFGYVSENWGRRLVGPSPEDPRRNRGLYGSDPLEAPA